MVLPGFNTDFKYRGETYHVQTEDNGVNNPMVVTLLYFKGAILASKKTPYRNLLEKSAYQKELMDLMKSQHKEIMRELLAGTYDGYLGGATAIPSAPAAAEVPVAAAMRPSSPAAIAPVMVAPVPPPRETPLTLDQAIMQYLKEYAASRGAAAILPER